MQNNAAPRHPADIPDTCQKFEPWAKRIAVPKCVGEGSLGWDLEGGCSWLVVLFVGVQGVGLAGTRAGRLVDRVSRDDNEGDDILEF